MALQYEPLKPLARDYTFTVQLFDSAGNKVAQGNDHVPGEPEYPSSRWRTHEVLQDQFEIELAPDAHAGEYKIMLRAYDAVDGTELGDLTEVGTLKIEE
jgi:hypothetical protein